MHCDQSQCLTAVFVQLVPADQHFASLGPVGGTENAGAVELIDHPGGAAVPDAEFPLQQRSGASAILQARLGRLTELGVPIARLVVTAMAATWTISINTSMR